MHAKKWRLNAPDPATLGGPKRPPLAARWGAREAPIPWEKVAPDGRPIPPLSGASFGPREWRDPWS